MDPSHCSLHRQLHPLTTSLSSSSLGPWQPTGNLSDSWGKHPPQPITHFPIKAKRTSWATREPKLPRPHWPHFQPLLNNSCLMRCSVVPLWQWGSSPGLSSGRHCWRCLGQLSQSGSVPQHGCASLLSAGPAGSPGSPCSHPCTAPALLFSAGTLPNPP